jgi:hypothetical protein
MRDALERARRYRNRAAECHVLAEAAQSAESKDHYRALAASYIALAEVEELERRGNAVGPSVAGKCGSSGQGPERLT